MKFSLLQFKEDLTANYWFYPLILAFLGIVLALGAEYLDAHHTYTWIIKTIWIYQLSAESARAILSTIAAGAITITSVIFSISLLTLSIVSNQVGSRLLPNFMRQNSTQIVLGSFIGIFIYCLITLRTINERSFEENYLPYVTVWIALCLGVIAFLLLIYFINYVCQAIQIDQILNYLNKDLHHVMQRWCPKIKQSEIIDYGEEKCSQKQKTITDEVIDIIKSAETGYIQTIDYDSLLYIAEKNKFVVETFYRPGHFIYQGLSIMKLNSSKKRPTDSTIKEILAHLQTGKRRTTTQDIEFGFEQLVEVAVRALSPSVNNPFVAVHCINHIAAGLAELSHRQLPSPFYYDENKQLRIIANSFTYAGVVNTALQRLREQAVGDASVAIRMLEIIGQLSERKLPPSFRQALLKQAQALYESCKNDDFHACELEEIECRFNRVFGTFT